MPCSPRITAFASDGPTRSIKRIAARIAGRLGDHVGYAFAPEALVLALQPETLAQRLAQLDLGLERGAEPSVVPRLLDVIAGAARIASTAPSTLL